MRVVCYICEACLCAAPCAESLRASVRGMKTCCLGLLNPIFSVNRLCMFYTAAWLFEMLYHKIRVIVFGRTLLLRYRVSRYLLPLQGNREQACCLALLCRPYCHLGYLLIFSRTDEERGLDVLQPITSVLSFLLRCHCSHNSSQTRSAALNAKIIH